MNITAEQKIEFIKLVTNCNTFQDLKVLNQAISSAIDESVEIESELFPVIDSSIIWPTDRIDAIKLIRFELGIGIWLAKFAFDQAESHLLTDSSGSYDLAQTVQTAVRVLNYNIAEVRAFIKEWDEIKVGLNNEELTECRANFVSNWRLPQIKK